MAQHPRDVSVRHVLLLVAVLGWFCGCATATPRGAWDACSKWAERLEQAKDAKAVVADLSTLHLTSAPRPNSHPDYLGRCLRIRYSRAPELYRLSPEETERFFGMALLVEPMSPEERERFHGSLLQRQRMWSPSLGVTPATCIPLSGTGMTWCTTTPIP